MSWGFICVNYVSSFFPTQGDDTDKDPEPETETENGAPAEKNSAKTSNSLESLYSGQSSSSEFVVQCIWCTR